MRKKIIGTLIILLNITSIIGSFIISDKYYNNVYHISFFINLSGLSIIISYLYLINAKPRFFKKYFRRSILLALSSILTVASYILFFVYLPKYTVQDAYTIITSDTRFMSDTFTNITPLKPNTMITSGNPFAEYAYRFLWEHNEITDWIYFDPINGEIYVNTSKMPQQYE